MFLTTSQLISVFLSQLSSMDEKALTAESSLFLSPFKLTIRAVTTTILINVQYILLAWQTKNSSQDLPHSPPVTRYSSKTGGIWVGWRWLSSVWKAALGELGWCHLRKIGIIRIISENTSEIVLGYYFVPLMSRLALSIFTPPFFFSLVCFPLIFNLIHRQLPPRLPFLGRCFYFPFCASVGNFAFPVIRLVGWLSVDFVQTVGSAFREGLVLDLQSLPIILSSFKQPIDNSLPPSATPATHKAVHWYIVVGFYGDGSLPLLFRLIVT